MYVKNLTNKDLTFNGNGSSIVLTANATTFIPNGLTTIQELQSMFGISSVVIDESGSGTTSILKNQQVVSTGKLYMTDPQTQIGDIRVFINGGTCDIYGSDNNEVPASINQMACPDENTDVDGVLSFACLPRYLVFKVSSSAPKVIITNCKLLEVKAIS